MTEVKWQSPPKAKAGPQKGKWRAIFDALRERPNEWALVSEQTSASTTQMIKNGIYGGAQAGEFEAVQRSTDSGKFDIYARYVGIDHV